MISFDTSSILWRLVRPDAISIWKNKEVKKRLNHYYKVMKNEKPAKYRVVKRIPVEEDIENLSNKELWNLHDSLSKEFNDFYNKIVEKRLCIDSIKIPEKSFLDVKIELVKRMLRSCTFCEWRCRVNRAQGEIGKCGLDWRTYVASAFLHLGEEAPLVPSGTIFFTGCSFKCVFCQNWDISTMPKNGEFVTPVDLATIATKLRKMGARNINYVGGNPDQQLHTIIESLKYMDINVPLLWNSNFYMSEEALKILLDVIDIWLPDFKYGNDKCALRLSKVPKYFEVVSRNLKIAYKHGDMIIRHLVLPNHVECCTRPVLEWIAKNCPEALVNVMDQYRPEHLVLKEPEKYSDINRTITSEELREAYKIAKELGLCYEPVS